MPPSARPALTRACPALLTGAGPQNHQFRGAKSLSRGGKAMTRCVVLSACVLWFGADRLCAQDVKPIDPDKALKIARLCTEATAKLADLPLTITPDVDKCLGVEADNRAGLVVPDAKLSPEAIAKAGGDVVPVGILYLHRVTPVVVERAVPADQQRVIEITAGDKKAAVSAWLLGMTRVADCAVLVVYTNGKAPAIVTTLIETADTRDSPVALDAQSAGEGRAVLLLTIAGKYRAALHLTGQD
jgi:hypothetical protein